MDNSNKPSGRVKFFPLFFWLVENGERKTVVRIPDSTALKEVNTLQELAREQGVTVKLEKASAIDWLDTH